MSYPALCSVARSGIVAFPSSFLNPLVILRPPQAQQTASNAHQLT
ncbi:hypothetical protein AB995_0001 [Lactococcus cremoris]|nr:hypothetical protein AB995_0001 [Lactococcus cremoris]